MARRRNQTPQQPAYRDALFMESIAARPVRILTEYLDPLVRLRREEVGDTIVIFGSARIVGRDRASAHLRRLKSLKGKQTPRRRLALREARAALSMSRYYEEARELARRITGQMTGRAVTRERRRAVWLDTTEIAVEVARDR